MLRGLINDAKSAAGAVVAKWAMRALVAVPFVVFALGFATAGAALVERRSSGSLGNRNDLRKT